MSFSDEAFPRDEAAPETESEPEVVIDGAATVETDSGDLPKADLPEADPMVELARQRDEFLLALQRTQADFENYRKRIARTQEEQSARAASALVTKLLPVLDTLDLAQAHQGEAESEDAKALTAARALLLDALQKEGLERVDQAGVPFDPSVHDAVARTEVEAGAEGEGEGSANGGGDVIDQVMRSGYRWRGQVLRPAMVSVRG
jgi:molecular chaperone GrpE